MRPRLRDPLRKRKLPEPRTTQVCLSHLGWSNAGIPDRGQFPHNAPEPTLTGPHGSTVPQDQPLRSPIKVQSLSPEVSPIISPQTRRGGAHHSAVLQAEEPGGVVAGRTAPSQEQEHESL